MPFAASRNPVDVTAQVLNDPSILDKSFDLLFGKENFPAMVAFFTTWASSPQMAEPLVQGGQRRRRALSRPLFRAVGDRHAGDAAAL